MSINKYLNNHSEVWVRALIVIVSISRLIMANKRQLVKIFNHRTTRKYFIWVTEITHRLKNCVVDNKISKVITATQEQVSLIKRLPCQRLCYVEKIVIMNKCSLNIWTLRGRGHTLRFWLYQN